MSYLQEVLQPGEKVLYRTTVSWTSYLPGIALFVIGAIAFLGLGMALLGLAIGAVAVILLAQAWFLRWTTEVAATDRRIILKRGFIRRHTIEMNMDKVESVDVDQSLLGRIFNYGDITVRGTGEGKERLRMIDSPLLFRSQVAAS